MARIAFVTGTGPYVRPVSDNIQPDDALAAKQLAEHGITVEGAIWSDASVPWDAYDLVILRSCWDYHWNALAFRDWVIRQSDAGVCILNDPALVLWNSHKRYLLDLQAQGVETLPTVVLEIGDRRSIADIALERAWESVVLKPAVALAGENVFRARAGAFEEVETERKRLNVSHELLLQEFCDAVVSEGEWALVFFNGMFSHAFLKRPAPGEFRVNLSLGGNYEPRDAPAEIQSYAQSVMSLLTPQPLYARIDLVRHKNKVILCELELIEPGLYFGLHPGSSAAFTSAVLERLAQKSVRGAKCPSSASVPSIANA